MPEFLTVIPSTMSNVYTARVHLTNVLMST